jgi:hypothetical protein
MAIYTIFRKAGAPREAVPVLDADGLTLEAHDWQLPLAHWRARLAQVTARLLRPRGALVGAAVHAADPAKFNSISLSAFLMDDGWPKSIRWNWSRSGLSHDGIRALDLPTLPRLLTDHAPEVALLLAVWEATRG